MSEIKTSSLCDLPGQADLLKEAAQEAVDVLSRMRDEDGDQASGTIFRLNKALGDTKRAGRTVDPSLSRLWRNWTVHNLFGHPLSQLAYWLFRPLGRARALRVSDLIHDGTLPLKTTLD